MAKRLIMPNPHSDVIAWLHTKQDWLQEVASKILLNSDITDTDIENFITILKTDNGKQVTDSRMFTELSTGVTTSSSLLLESICDVKGIDSLAPRNPLTFGLNNLVVVYGNNGSGKSGYTRILKKVSGKPNTPNLKNNVYETEPAEMYCKIKYRLDDVEHEEGWIANSCIIEDLNGIDIFDSDTAKVYLTKDKEASYIPDLVGLFEKMVSVCKRINVKLEEEKRLLSNVLPSIPPEYSQTTSARLYNGLLKTHTETSLDSILLFSENEQARLDDIIERLSSINLAEDAKRVRKQNTELIKIIASIFEASTLLNKEASEKLFECKKTAVEKRSIVIEVGEKHSSLAELDGLGSATWKKLWETAREYSTREAYPAYSYPHIQTAKCVLCQQDLDDNAKKRLLDFEDFINSKLEEEAVDSEKILNELLNKLPIIPGADSLGLMIQVSGLDNDIWGSKIKSLWDNIDSVSREFKNVNTEIIPPCFSEPSELDELKLISSQYESKASQLEDDAEEFNREQVKKELVELEAQKWTSSHSVDILTELERLRDIALYEELIRLTNTRSISIKAGEVSEKIITTEFITRFNEELSLLGAETIKVELKKTGVEGGVVKHQVRLRNIDTHSLLVDVLSEGEQRIISLSAFLADVRGRTAKTPFIFDDPISSLDQDFEERVIDRLVSLSETRQVIIFTHRLSLLALINERADSIEQVHIRKEVWGSGEIGEIPLFGRKPENALKNLKNSRLVKARNVLNTDGSEDYYPLAKAICSDYRILLERIVEYYLLADVVQRHRRAIQTMGKLDKLAKITEDDCAFIDGYMTKYSIYEHSQPIATPPKVPEPNELEEDIDSVLGWYEDFKSR